MSKVKKLLGQTMVEYVIIIALCAIGLLLVITFFGNDIKQIFWTSSQSLRSGANQKVTYDAQIEGEDFGSTKDEHTTEDLDK